ncbi:MAG: hypothetical protein SFT68_00430 [Rickettsiaceae bacterium]|nr:hypothetical protein [Rickettsiaceae bacterium]
MTNQNNHNLPWQNSSRIGFTILSLFLFVISGAQLSLASSTSKRQSQISSEVLSEVSSQIFFHNKQAKLIAFASNKSQVRISFPPFTIKEVVGDTNKYKIIHDRLGMSIFILPKVGKGEEIDLTIITASGKSQDILLKIKDKVTANSIIIYDKNLSDDPLQNRKYKITNQEILEAKKLLKAMRVLKKSKYNVTNFDLKSSPRLSHNIGYLSDTNNKESALLEIKASSIYGYKLLGLKGVILEIRNKGNNSIYISEEDISSLFAGVILTSIKSNIIAPKSRTKVYLVLKESEED